MKSSVRRDIKTIMTCRCSSLLRSAYLSVSVPRIPVASALVANIRAKKMESSFILKMMIILSWWKCNDWKL